MAADVRRTIHPPQETIAGSRASAAATPLRALLLVAAVWTAAGVARGAIGAAIQPGSLSSMLHSMAVGIVVKWFWVPITIAVFAIQRRRPDGDTTRDALLEHALLFAIITVFETWWAQAVQAYGGTPPPYVPMLFGRLDTNLLTYVGLVVALRAVTAYRRGIAIEGASARMEAALADAEARVLTMQLQPHFLFNTLHLVSEMVYEDARSARDTLANLRNLLVQSFAYAARREVTVEEELGFLAAYLAIQERRFRGRVVAIVEADPGIRDALLPHLMLQPLVENAIRHGIAPRARGGTVTIAVRARGEWLEVIVADDGVGLGKAGEGSTARGGLGVAHTRLRLERLYGESFAFDVVPGADGGARTRVELPLHRQPIPDAVVPDDAFAAFPEVVPAASSGIGAAWRRLPLVARVVVVWTGIALFWIEVDVLNRWTHARDLMLGSSLSQWLFVAAAGAVVTFPALPFARRWPARPGRVAVPLAQHLGIAFAVGAAHCALVLVAFDHAPASWDFFAISSLRDFRLSLVAWMMWDGIAYLTAVAFAHREALAAWYRESRVAAAELQARMARANVALVRLRVQPALLLEGIDLVSAAAAGPPRPCEEMIARLGDLLRAMLAGTPVELETLRRDLAEAAR